MKTPKFVRSALEDSPVLMIQQEILDKPGCEDRYLCMAYESGKVWRQEVHHVWLEDGRFYACTNEGERIEEASTDESVHA